MRQVELEENPKQDDPIGKTDYHFFTKEVADRYRANDLAVMESQKESTVEEPVTLPNGKTITQLSTKRPFKEFLPINWIRLSKVELVMEKKRVVALV